MLRGSPVVSFATYTRSPGTLASSIRVAGHRIIGPTMIDVAASAEAIRDRCRDAGNADRAVSERAYLKSDLEHLGTSVSEIRRVVKDFLSAHLDLTRDELVSLTRLLWAEPVHECRMSAVMLVELDAPRLGPGDLDLVETMIRGSRSWAYVDALAANVAGSLLVRYPELASRIDRWAVDDNFWVRRSALLAMILPLKQGAAFETFAGYADAMLDQKEFFIRKAIGWVLRDTSKRRPLEVYEWVLPRASRASGVTLREAVKYLDPVQRQEVLEAAGKRPS
jgi:3-methyladenine DNA glycosylase AlkD